MGRKTSGLERIHPTSATFCHTLRADTNIRFCKSFYFDYFVILCVFWHLLIPLGLLQLYRTGRIVWTNVWPSHSEGNPEASRSIQIAQIVLLPSFFHLPSSGWWTLCILRKGRGTYRYSLWCCRPCWDAWLVPALDLSSRMPADVRIRTLVLNLLDLVPKFRPRCSTSNGSMMTTGISEHQRQEDDFAQTVNGQPRKHRRSASNMFKERRSLQSQPVDACSLSCHISRQFWGITDFEFFPRPWLREKQWHTVHDMHWPPMIHGHSNAGRKRKSPQPDLTPGHSDRIQTYYSNIFWSSQVMVFDRFHVFCLYVCVFCVECRITQLRLSACCGITRHSSRLSQVSCTTMTSWRLELPTTIRLHRHTLYIRCEVSGQVQTLSFINCCMLLPVLESSRNTMLLYIYTYIYIYVTDILIFVAYPDRLWNTKKILRC